MKPRHSEAARLESDYLARVRTALAGRAPEEITEVVESVQAHIEESAPAQADEISLTQMAQILEQLGPPQTYEEPHALAAPPAPPTAPPPPPLPANPAAIPPNTPPDLTDYVNQPFDFARCASDAFTLYTRNFLPLLLANIVVQLLSTITLLILAGPLCGGLCLMTLNLVRHPNQKVDFGDTFRLFNRFWPLLGAFFLLFFLELAGTLACLVPAVLILALFGLQMYFMVDKGLGIIDSLRAACAMTTAPGRFGINCLLMLTVLGVSLAAASIPYVGFAISWLVTPLLALMCTLAYLRQDHLGIPLPTPPATAAPAPSPVAT